MSIVSFNIFTNSKGTATAQTKAFMTICAQSKGKLRTFKIIYILEKFLRCRRQFLAKTAPSGEVASFRLFHILHSVAVLRSLYP